MNQLGQMDFYSLLQVPKTASNVDILNNYKKHILYTEEKGLMSEALEVLTSPLRQIYDSYGYGILHYGLPAIGSFVGFKPYQYHGDTAKTFERVFGKNEEIQKITQMLESVEPLKVKICKLPSISVVVDITLEEVYTGCQKTVSFEKRIFQNSQVTRNLEHLLVDIPNGVLPGYEVTFSEFGDQLPFTIPSNKISNVDDVIVTVNVVENIRYTRKNLNLHVTIEIPLKTRLCGGSIEVPTISGKNSIIFVTSEIEIIKKAGLYCGAVFGDLIVHFKVVFPLLSPKAKLSIGQIL